MLTVRADSVAPQPWKNGGGVTRHLAADAEGDAWRWRISLADITADGPFSAYPGVERWFAVVSGVGVELTLQGSANVLRPHDPPFVFDGAHAPGCRLLAGTTRDLNLMLQGGARGVMRRAGGGVIWTEDWPLRGHFDMATLTLHWGLPAGPATAAGPGYWIGGGAVKTLWRHARLATLAGPGWGWHAQGALVTDGDRIVWAGDEAALPPLAVDAEHGLGGLLVTPGLVDCHTHLVYGGQRAREFEQRLEGASYEDIARAGGGIRSTVAATRAASDEALFSSAAARARTLMADGVTTLEVKSGYGLALEHEARCLRVARRLGRELPLAVRTTCLAAHALPPEYEGRPDDYVDAVCGWLPVLHAEGLVDAVDAFCERIAFTPAQTQRVFEAARALGLPVKLHAEQLSDQGGAALAAAHGALSCDHLEWLSPAGVQAMAAAGSVAVLLPGAFYFLRETKLPPVAALREAGVPIAIASDHNPGSSPGLSMTLMLNMACTLFRLTPEEALRGATVHGARALGLADRGTLAPGQRADFAVWALEHPHELAYWFGHNPCRRTVVGGTAR